MTDKIINEGLLALVSKGIEQVRQDDIDMKAEGRHLYGVDTEKLIESMMKDEYFIIEVKKAFRNSFNINVNEQYPKTGEELWKMNADT